MDLRHLEQIYEICREGSFSAAARKLGVTQPTLSRSIARLEAQLRIKLFERAGGAVKPTDYGQFLADGASALLEEAAALRRELDSLALKEGGSLRIGIGPGSGLRLVPQLFNSVTAQFPALRLEIHHREDHAVTKALGEGRYDLVFCYSVAAEEFGDFIRVKIFDDAIIFAARAGHPALSRQPLTPAVVKEYAVASVSRNPKFIAWLGDLTPDQARNATAFMSDDMTSIKERALKSDCLIRLPRFVLAHELHSGELVEVTLADWPTRFECWMLTTAACWKSPVVKVIASLAKDTAAAYGPA